MNRTLTEDLNDRILKALASAEIKSLTDIAEIALEAVGYFDSLDQQKVTALQGLAIAVRQQLDARSKECLCAEMVVHDALINYEKLACRFYRKGKCSEGTCGENICCFECEEQKCEEHCPTPCVNN